MKFRKSKDWVVSVAGPFGLLVAVTDLQGTPSPVMLVFPAPTGKFKLGHKWTMLTANKLIK